MHLAECGVSASAAANFLRRHMSEGTACHHRMTTRHGRQTSAVEQKSTFKSAYNSSSSYENRTQMPTHRLGSRCQRGRLADFCGLYEKIERDEESLRAHRANVLKCSSSSLSLVVISALLVVVSTAQDMWYMSITFCLRSLLERSMHGSSFRLFNTISAGQRQQSKAPPRHMNIVSNILEHSLHANDDDCIVLLRDQWTPSLLKIHISKPLE